MVYCFFAFALAKFLTFALFSVQSIGEGEKSRNFDNVVEELVLYRRYKKAENDQR